VGATAVLDFGPLPGHPLPGWRRALAQAGTLLGGRPGPPGRQALMPRFRRYFSRRHLTEQVSLAALRSSGSICPHTSHALGLIDFPVTCVALELAL
jgi:hypothetical protein